jgi:hypothetical protein
MRLVDLYDVAGLSRDYLAAKYPNEDGVIQIPERLHEVYALLLDAKLICQSTPWASRA